MLPPAGQVGVPRPRYAALRCKPLREAEEKPELWRQMAEIWPDYDNYQRRTERSIPVVILERQPG